MRPPCLLLFLLYLPPFATCHPTEPKHLDRRDETIPLDDRLEDDSIRLLGGANGNSEVAHATVNYGKTKRGLGLKSATDSGIFVETNFGIWGCRIQETVFDQIIGKTSKPDIKGILRHTYKPIQSVYQELFEGRCLKQMEEALKVWSTSGDGSFEFRVTASQFYTTITRSSRVYKGAKKDFNAPYGHKTVLEMAQSMTALLGKYDATYGGGVRLLGPFVGDKMKPDRDGFLVQQEAIPDKGPTKVNIYASGSGHDAREGTWLRTLEGTGECTAMEIEMPWSSLFLKRNLIGDGCADDLYWMPSALFKDIDARLDAQSQVAFNSFTSVKSFKLPLANEDLLIQTYPDL